MSLTSILNLLFSSPDSYEAPVLDLPAAGDIVRDSDGSLCCIQRIGWNNGELSPFVGHDVLQAYVFGFCEDGSCWVDWVDLHTLSTETVSEADKDTFCTFVKRDLASLRRSFSVVDMACDCGE